MKKEIGGAEAEANALRSAILSASDELDITGTKYYISNNGDDCNDGLSPVTAWKTLDKFHSLGNFLKHGDGVLFERGSIFRMKREITLTDGVAYGAYGIGSKPELWGCERNFALPELWEKDTNENIWILEMSDSAFIGNIVFDYDRDVGILKSELADVKKDLDYYFDAPKKKLYLCLSSGNPGTVYKDIEICVRHAIFSGLMYAHDIRIDNICMKYTGAGQVEFSYGYIKNIFITNCEICWGGGSYLWDGSRKIRGGNGIGSYNDVKNMKITRNWIYQIYDAGISPQGDPGMNAEDIEISNNLIEYCTWSYEQWVGQNKGIMKNNYIKNNIMRMSGYGWAATQRPDWEYDSHFCAWSYDLTGCFENYYITDNIFDCSAQGLVAWHWEKGEPEHEGLFISGNVFYQKPNKSNVAIWYGYSDSYYGMLKKATSQEQLEECVKVFDRNYQSVKWLG